MIFLIPSLSSSPEKHGITCTDRQKAANYQELPIALRLLRLPKILHSQPLMECQVSKKEGCPPVPPQITILTTSLQLLLNLLTLTHLHPPSKNNGSFSTLHPPTPHLTRQAQ